MADSQSTLLLPRLIPGIRIHTCKRQRPRSSERGNRWRGARQQCRPQGSPRSTSTRISKRSRWSQSKRAHRDRADDVASRKQNHPTDTMSLNSVRSHPLCRRQRIERNSRVTRSVYQIRWFVFRFRLSCQSSLVRLKVVVAVRWCLGPDLAHDWLMYPPPFRHTCRFGSWTRRKVYKNELRWKHGKVCAAVIVVLPWNSSASLSIVAGCSQRNRVNTVGMTKNRHVSGVPECTDFRPCPRVHYTDLCQTWLDVAKKRSSLARRQERSARTFEISLQLYEVIYSIGDRYIT